MNTIIEEPEIGNIEKSDKGLKSKLQSQNKLNTNSRQVSLKQIISIKDNQTMEKFGIDNDIYAYIEDIQKIQRKQPKHQNQVKTIYSIKQEGNDKLKKHIGISDNLQTDAENKSKAQKGLLELLNKLSGGTFVPEIKTYFNKKKEEMKLNKENVKQNEGKNEKIERKESLGKKINRQSNLNHMEEDKEETNNLNKKYVPEKEEMTQSESKLNNNLIKTLLIKRNKNYTEDEGFDLCELLKKYFPDKVANEFSTYKKKINNDNETKNILYSKFNKS